MTASYSARRYSDGGIPNAPLAAGPMTSVFPIAILICEAEIPGADPGGDTQPEEDPDAAGEPAGELPGAGVDAPGCSAAPPEAGAPAAPPGAEPRPAPVGELVTGPPACTASTWPTTS